MEQGGFGGAVPIKQGWMLKKGRIVKNCTSTTDAADLCVCAVCARADSTSGTGKRRYFVLYPDVLYYYSKPSVRHDACGAYLDTNAHITTVSHRSTRFDTIRCASRTNTSRE